MPHNPGGTVSKADLQAAELSFATASAAYTNSETNYNKAESDFFTLESQLITADNQLFESQVFLDKLIASEAKDEEIEEAESDVDEKQDIRDDAFLAFRTKDVVVRQSESIFLKSERTYFEEQDHLFQVQDQFNFQVSELRESTGVRSGIQNNFDQYLFTGRDSATDATNRTNAQTRLTNQNTELATLELDLDGFNRALSFVSEDWESIWIREGRVGAPAFVDILKNRSESLKTGQDEIDVRVNDAFKSVNEIWTTKTGVLALWADYDIAFGSFTSNSNILKNNPGQIEELESNLSSLFKEIKELDGELKEAKNSGDDDLVKKLKERMEFLDNQSTEIDKKVEQLKEQLEEAQLLFNEEGADFGTGYVAKLQLYKNKIAEVELPIAGIERAIDEKEEEIDDLKSSIASTEIEIEQYEAILRPKEDALAITEIFVEQIAGAITAGGDSEKSVIKKAKEKGQKAGENITAADALSLARSFNWSMKQIKSKITEAAEKGETSIIVESLSPATVSVLNDMGYNMRLVGVEKTVLSGGIGEQRREVAVDQEVEISWLFAREASLGDYTAAE